MTLFIVLPTSRNESPLVRSPPHSGSGSTEDDATSDSSSDDRVVALRKELDALKVAKAKKAEEIAEAKKKKACKDEIEKLQKQIAKLQADVGDVDDTSGDDTDTTGSRSSVKKFRKSKGGNGTVKAIIKGGVSSGSDASTTGCTSSEDDFPKEKKRNKDKEGKNWKDANKDKKDKDRKDKKSNKEKKDKKAKNEKKDKKQKKTRKADKRAYRSECDATTDGSIDTVSTTSSSDVGRVDSKYKRATKVTSVVEWSARIQDDCDGLHREVRAGVLEGLTDKTPGWRRLIDTLEGLRLWLGCSERVENWARSELHALGDYLFDAVMKAQVYCRRGITGKELSDAGGASDSDEHPVVRRAAKVALTKQREKLRMRGKATGKVTGKDRHHGRSAKGSKGKY